MRVGKSTSIRAGARPSYRGCAVCHTMRAASIRFFDGRQPRLAHVPPTVRRSTIVTRAPSSLALIAAAKAVDPEPRIRRSYGSAMSGGSPSSLEGVVLASGAHGPREGRALDVGSGRHHRRALREIDGDLLDVRDGFERAG